VYNNIINGTQAWIQRRGPREFSPPLMETIGIYCVFIYIIYIYKKGE